MVVLPPSAEDAPCQVCGAAPSRIVLGGEPLCDRCFDRRIAAQTGYPELPEPPPPVMRRGADGRKHHVRYRLWRAPTGIVAEAEEVGVPVLEGYQAKVIGPHDADVAELFGRLEAQLARKLRRRDLEPGPNGPVLAGMTLAGRLEWNEEGGPYDVIVGGRRYTWDEVGRMLEPFEGYEFEVRVMDMEVVGDLGLPGEDDAPIRLH